MPSEVEKRNAVYECLRASQSLGDIIRFLEYPKRTVYDLKKRFDAEMAVNGNVTKGLGEPSAKRKKHNRRSDSMDMVDEDFIIELQRKIDSDPGRSMAGLATDMGVHEKTIRRYVRVHIRYKSYKMRRG